MAAVAMIVAISVVFGATIMATRNNWLVAGMGLFVLLIAIGGA